MNIDIAKARKLFEIKKNQLKMVQRRGYEISKEESLLSYTFEQFLDAYVPFAEKENKSLREVFSTTYKNPEQKKLVVYFAEPSKKQLGVEVFGDFLKEMNDQKSNNGIIITGSALTPATKKEISKLPSNNIYTFMEDEMTYDPTEHFLVPKHRALSVEEQRNFLNKNDISIDQLPTILTTDMISRYYGFQTGQVIEIKRTNLYDTIVQYSTSYRVVKDEPINL